jgi:hypothetical protein
MSRPGGQVGEEIAGGLARHAVLGHLDARLHHRLPTVEVGTTE